MKTLIPADDTEQQLLRHISTGPHPHRRGAAAAAACHRYREQCFSHAGAEGLVRQMGSMSYVRAREAGAAYGA